MPWPKRMRRGPYSFLAANLASMPEGAKYEAGILAPDGSTFEMLWLGGHDGTNHLLGGGFQITTGKPGFAAPIGAALFDTATCTIWVSTAYTGVGSGSGSGSGSGVGQWCPISETGGGVGEIDTTPPILGGPITAGQTGTISHAISGVTPGSYTNADITVDEWGHVTEASNGSSGISTNRLFSQYTANGSTSTTETLFTGYSFTVPGGTLAAGDALRVRAWGSFDAQGDVFLYCGGNLVNSASNTSTATQQAYSIEFELIVGTTSGGQTSVTLTTTKIDSVAAGITYPSFASVPDLSANSLTIELKGTVNTGGFTVWARGMGVWKE